MAFEHVVWIGGGTGAGKTTVARALSRRHGLRALHVDAFWYAYDARLDEPRPTPDEQWLGPRWENEAVAANLRSWLASSDVVPEAPVSYPFACECGGRGCSAQVEPTLAEYFASRACSRTRSYMPIAW